MLQLQSRTMYPATNAYTIVTTRYIYIVTITKNNATIAAEKGIREKVLISLKLHSNKL